MSNILLNISEKIDPNQVEVLQAIKDVADSLNIAFFVVGASARDFILQHCYNVKPDRMTKDVDIGVEVEDWNEDRLYEKEQDLLKEEGFDIQLAGTRLLGKDMAAIADPDTIKTVKAILDQETDEQTRFRLVEDMIWSSFDRKERFEDVLNLVKKLTNELNNTNHGEKNIS